MVALSAAHMAATSPSIASALQRSYLSLTLIGNMQGKDFWGMGFSMVKVTYQECDCDSFLATKNDEKKVWRANCPANSQLDTWCVL
jgi:hypothetical protein